MIILHCAKCKSSNLIVDPHGGYWCKGCHRFLALYKTIQVAHGDQKNFCPTCDGFGAVGMEERSFKTMLIDDRLRSVITACKNCNGTGEVNE